MQSDISLNGPFYYSNTPLVIVILLIIVTIIILVCININKDKKKEEKTIVVVKPKDINSLKIKYINELNNLSNNIHIFSKRQIYNILSQTIRSFVLEATNIDVLKYSLNEIRVLNIEPLTELVEEYYEPEFSKESTANPINSINKTKEVINKWK